MFHVFCREDAAPGCFDDVAAVAPPSDLKVWSTYRVKTKLRQKARIAVQFGVLENAREMRIGDDLLFNLIAPIRVGVQDAICERIRPGALHAGLKMALFFMEESLAIGDEILKVANLWAVQRGVIGFGDNAIPKSEPEAAGGGVSVPTPSLAPFVHRGSMPGLPKAVRLPRNFANGLLCCGFDKRAAAPS